MAESQHTLASAGAAAAALEWRSVQSNFMRGIGMITKDLFSLKGRVALITGGSRGIGKMIAEGFIAQGAKVYISARKADACNQTAKDLSKDGGTCISIPMNVSTVPGAKGLAAAVMAQEPKVDILVNNAGAAWGAAFDEVPVE